MNVKQKEIYELLSQAVNTLSENYKGSSLTDIFLLVDEDSGELSVYDDEQNRIIDGIIKEWQDSDNIDYADDLKTVIRKMDDNSKFNSLDVYTPFSINLADEDFIVTEELLLIEDDSIVRIEDEFLKRMDKEFDEFLDRLMKE